MTRRRWFASLFATLLGASGATRARAAAVPPPAAPAPVAGGTSVTYCYDAAYGFFPAFVDPCMVTTYVYGCPGRPYPVG
jgi:hypothetical protein